MKTKILFYMLSGFVLWGAAPPKEEMSIQDFFDPEYIYQTLSPNSPAKGPPFILPDGRRFSYNHLVNAVKERMNIATVGVDDLVDALSSDTDYIRAGSDIALQQLFGVSVGFKYLYRADSEENRKGLGRWVEVIQGKRKGARE